MWTWQEALRICMPSGTQYGPVAQYGDFTVDRDAMQMAYENMVAAMQSRTEALEKELTVELMRNQEAERKLEVGGVREGTGGGEWRKETIKMAQTRRNFSHLTQVAQRKMQQQDTAGRQMEAQQVSNMMSHARTYTTTSDSRKMSEDSESANACLLRQLIHVDVNQRDKAAMDQVGD